MTVKDEVIPGKEGSDPQLYVPTSFDPEPSAPPAASAPDIEESAPPKPPAAAPTSTSGPIIQTNKLGRKPFQHVCTNCNTANQTQTRTELHIMAWVCCCFLVLFFWPLFWVPFVIPACRKTKHYCRKCGILIGTSNEFL
mmetsp:Transcript_20276/g.31070  ORF Transcript_20276/g.31070 Transcript_20276/m.31070 type:complete len:139 (-) Transcript_20276:176-592(-)